MVKYIFIGGILTPRLKASIENGSKGCIQYAADTLQKSYIEGLVGANIDITCLNLPFVGNYPKLSNIKSFSKNIENIQFDDNIVTIQNLHFTNILLYKNFSRYKSLKSALYKLCQAHTDDKLCLVVYSAHTPFMIACANIKKKFPNIKTILIVPDLPEFMASSRGLSRFIRNINIKLAHKLYSIFDGFIFLSEYMKDRIHVANNNYKIIEGIYSTQDYQPLQKSSNLNIIYTGTLAKRYGILNLVSAFLNINNPQARLLIIGAGDAVNTITELAKNDHRIKYLGQLPREEVLKIQSTGTLLVNPRTSAGEFTKYSFPSKTMEYLASGVPTLINKLPGIPEEYYKYSFQPKNESVEALTEKIIEILNMPEEDRIIFGNKAKEFIITNKNPIAQCRKLIDLAQNIVLTKPKG